jgi:uncharacterized caspase-like protein
MLRRALALLGLLAAVLVSADARAERRVALVIGNAQYEHATTLRNPLNDANDIAAVLRTLGFEVVVGTDLDQRAFANQIDQFGRMLDGADVGLFFYAGHGLQVNDKNYLVSTRAKLENEFLIPAEAVELDSIIRLMESRSRVNLVFLDACRNNPLADKLRQSLIAANRSVALGRGLARIEPTGRDTLIAFAAAPGQEAADGRARNSPFTAALLQHMPTPGLEVSLMLKQVTAQVRRETNNTQRPQQLSDMSRTFYFAEAEPMIAVQQPAQVAPVADYSVEVAYWNSARSGNDCESVRAYLERYPDGIFSDLAMISERRLCEPGRKIAVREQEPSAAEPVQPVKVAAVQGQVVTTTGASSPMPEPRLESITAARRPQGLENKVAALRQSAAPKPEPPEPDESAALADLARDLQAELARVGCSTSPADGIWGPLSREALREFNRYARASLDPEVPSKAALAAVQRRQRRVCPLEERPEPIKREAVRSREQSPPSPPVERRSPPVRSALAGLLFGRPSPVMHRAARSPDRRSIDPLCQAEAKWPAWAGRYQ